MGKRGFATTIIDATIVDDAKKAKKAAAPRDPKAPRIGEWDCSKFLEKDLHKAMNEELPENDVEE
jgi:hypothetical protein